MKGITRYEHPKTGKGWQARTQWKGQMARQRFADSIYGGYRAARKAAVDWIRWQNDQQRKANTERWIRSEGRWGRSGKTGKWTRREP